MSQLTADMAVEKDREEREYEENHGADRTADTDNLQEQVRMLEAQLLAAQVCRADCLCFHAVLELAFPPPFSPPCFCSHETPCMFRYLRVFIVGIRTFTGLDMQESTLTQRI